MIHHNLYIFDRYEVIRNVHAPSVDFKFPSHVDYGKQRHFSHAWLRDHSSWLVSSKALDGGFCLPCVLFATPQANRAVLIILFFYLLFYSEFPPNAPIIPKDCPIILNYNSELFPSKIKESVYKNMSSYESMVVLSIRVFSIVLTPRV